MASEVVENRAAFKPYGWFGLILIIFGEINLIVGHSGHHPVAGTISMWTTPICWWGYILFIDACIFRLKKESLISNRRREFLFQIPLSVLFWLIFELYNLHLKNWHYQGLPENLIVRNIGYFVAFATIMPGLFLTAELLETVGIFKRFRIAKLRVSNRVIYGGVILGLIFTISPLLLETSYAQYMFGLVWIGFIFLIDPLLYCSGGDSLLKELEKGELNRVLSLFVGGYLCGVFWEFWNYWASTKWVYTVPFTQDIKFFEMPLAGFLGFGPFAWEYYVLFGLAKLFLPVKNRE
jgi:hypothetical protein